MIRHAIFDLDGTLVDSLPGIGWSIQTALAACGVACLVPDLKPLIGPPIRAILAALSGSEDPALLDRLERAFRSSYDSEGWRKTVLQPGAAGTLEELRRRGIALWLVTNKPRFSTELILRELGMEGLFQEAVCRDSRTPPFSSKAEMVLDLLERRGLERRGCLLIGDTLEDARAASCAGVSCALVPHGYGGERIPAPGEVQPWRLSGWGDLLNCVSRRPGEMAEGAAIV